MTKKETAEMDALRDQLRLARAMRFTEEVKPDLPPPIESGATTIGFYFNSYDRGRVDVGCSSRGFHGRGQTDKTTSQGSLPLYSTRLLALRGLRHEVEKEVAKRLAAIDKMIEQEASNA